MRDQKTKVQKEKTARLKAHTKTNALVLIVSYLILVAANTFGEVYKFAGVTAADVSNEVFAWFAPAGYVFSIWSIIYIGLIVWIVRFIKDYKNHHEILGLPVSAEPFIFAITCVLNISWLAVWHLKIFAATIPIIIALLATVGVLYFLTWKRSKSWIDRTPLAIYASWLVVATVANIAHVITRFTTSDAGIIPAVSTLAILVVLVGATFLIHYFLNDYAFGAVVAWAGIGIGVHLIPTAPLIGVTAILISTIGVAVALFPWIAIRNRSSN